MKKFKIWSMIMLVVMALPFMVACGGDDGESKNVDGVNVTNGKKLIELSFPIDSIYSPWGTYYYDAPTTYKMEYDPDGKLIKVLNKSIGFKKGDDGKMHSYFTGNYTEIVSIDYELRLISYMSESSSSQKVGFSLNKDGYIDQIGACTLNYDTNGYLIGVEDKSGISTLVYKNDDFIKASVLPLTKGRTKLYYVSYGKTPDTGDLYIHGQYTSDPKRRLSSDGGTIACFMAFQNGLFGKVTNTFINLKNEKQASALFDYEDDYDSYSLKVHFVWQ